MTLEEEVRAFAAKYVPSPEHYLSQVPVPAFGGHTWEDVFSGKARADARLQRAVLKRLRDIFGSKKNPDGLVL